MTENQPSRVVLIGEPGSTQEQIATALGASAEFNLVGVLRNLERLSIDISANEPDILLIDHEIAPNNLPALIDDLSLRFPSISAVVLLPDENPATAQQVMLAGARAFIIKPFTQVNLVNTLRRVRTLDMARQRVQQQAGPPLESKDRPLHTLTVYSPKGGVGATTLALNLAIAHHQEFGGRVLLLEGKMFFGHTDVALNILTGNSITDLIPHASNLDDILISDVIYKHASGIHVLLAPRNMQSAQGVRADSLFSVFMALSRRYDYIIIDAGSALNENSITLMDAADRILLVTTPDLPTLHDVSQFIQFSPTLAIPVDKLLFVVNREGIPGGVRRRDIESSLGQDIFAAIPDDGANAIRSFNRGVPMVLRYSRSPMSRAIRDLAKKLAGIKHTETVEVAVGAPGE